MRLNRASMNQLDVGDMFDDSATDVTFDVGMFDWSAKSASEKAGPTRQSGTVGQITVVSLETDFDVRVCRTKRQPATIETRRSPKKSFQARNIINCPFDQPWLF